MVGYGSVCGFSGTNCTLDGRGNSTYMNVSVPFLAHSDMEVFTVYLSWFNGNFGVPLFLDGLVVGDVDGGDYELGLGGG